MDKERGGERKRDLADLNLDEIKDGKGGYSTDPSVIEHDDLRVFMTGVSEYFDKNQSDFYSVPNVVGKLKPKQLNEGGVKYFMDKMAGNGYTHFFLDDGRTKGERIEIEAFLAAAHTYRSMKSRRPVEDIVFEATMRLGSYYATIPLLLGGRFEVPNYLEHREMYAQNTNRDQNGKESGGEEGVGEENVMSLFESEDFGVDLNLDRIREAREAVENKMTSLAGVDRFDAEVSWPIVGIRPEEGKMAAFIYHADKGLEREFDNDRLVINYDFLHRVLTKCEEYLTVYGEKIPDLRTLYSAVNLILKNNPR